MNELSLFTGAGGGLLGTHLLGWRTIGYVEKDDYCQQVLRQRVRDGILPHAPIFGDIRAFIDRGFAAEYQGMVDVLTAGFPCQPFSVAGKRLGPDDSRNMWPATIECIRIIRPRYALLENVPGLLNPSWERVLDAIFGTGTMWAIYRVLKRHPAYFGRVLGDLAEAGYDAKWRVLSAAEICANHRRARLWILAYPAGNGKATVQHSGQRDVAK